MQSRSPSNISNIFFPLDKFVFVALNTDDIYGRVGKEMRQGLSAIGMQLTNQENFEACSLFSNLKSTTIQMIQQK